MSLYAKINSENIVENVVVCEDSQIALFDGKYIKVTELTGDAFVDGSYNESSSKFVKPKPYDSWTLNADLEWVAPSTKPGFGYFWNESDLEWVAVEGYDPNLAAE